MPEQLNILSAEEEAKKLKTELQELRAGLAKESEDARGKLREDIQLELHKVTERLDAVVEQIAAHEREALPGLEVLDPTKHKTEKDGKDKYALSRHIKLCISAVRPDAPIDISDCGYEMDALNQFALKKKGATLPEIVKHASQNVGQDSAGGVFVPNEVSSALIPELVAATVSGRAGVTFLSGLSGDLTFPKKVSGISGQWLDTEAEASIATETLSFGSIRMTPHPYAGAVPLTWLALRQPAQALEPMVRMDMSEKLGLLLDLGIVKGTAQQGQPRGIVNWADIGSTSWSGAVFGTSAGSGGATTYDTSKDKLRAHVQDLRSANALGDGRSLGWIAEPDVLTKFEAAKTRNGDDMYLRNEDPQVERLLRYPIFSSTAMASGSASAGFLLFGKFNEAVVGSWGGLAFDVSNAHASNFLTGVVVIRAIGAADVMVRQPLAFSNAASFTTTV